MLERSRVPKPGRLAALLVALLLGFGVSGWAQSQGEKLTAGPAVARASVPISFLPPPLDGATYSLGIYEVKSGKLIRHLHEIAAESAFTVGLNGLITQWDGKDDAGQLVPPGRYAARGYAVGALKVEGTDILGNDWARAGENQRIKHIEAIELDPLDKHLLVFATSVGDRPELLELDGREGNDLQHDFNHVGRTAISQRQAAGKDHTTWRITDDCTLIQEAADGTVLRKLTTAQGDPPPVGVVASSTEDRIYLLEEMPGWQRVRGLSWLETKEEDGKQVSTWQTFFERNIRIPRAPELASAAGAVEVSLMENPLDPGKPQKAKLAASFDAKGSYLTSADGLRLRQISQRTGLTAAKLTKGKTTGSLAFFQTDGAAWDEFSIEGARNMMAFDAGEFELTATGEKPVTEKAPEPPDL